METRVCPNQFRRAANPNRRVRAKGVVGRLNSKKEYKKMNKNKKAFEDKGNIFQIKRGKEPYWNSEPSDKGVLPFSYFHSPGL